MQRYQQSDRIIAASTSDDEIVMMDTDQATYFALEESAAHIWSLFETPSTPDEIVALVSNHYDVDPGVCRRETLAFIQDLVAREMIVPAG